MGVSFIKKFPTQLMYLGPHNAGCFEQTGVSANQHKMVKLIFFQQFLAQNQNTKRDIYGKNLHLVNLEPHGVGCFS